MNTTNLFVELIVIGVGAVIWVLLLALSVFGYPGFSLNPDLWPIFLMPFLAITYLLGIITDRVADSLIEYIWNDDLRDSYFENREQYYNARRIIFLKSEKMTDLLEYGRSRLRICRGWVFNGLAIAGSLLVFKHNWTSDVSDIVYFGCGLSLSLSVLSFYSWRMLTKVEYKKIREQSAFLLNQNIDKDIADF